VRLVLLGSHRLFVQSLAAALTAAGHQVDLVTAGPGVLAPETPLVPVPDVCLLDADLQTPDQCGGAAGQTSGAGLVGLAHAIAPDAPVVLLSGECTPATWAAYDDHLVAGIVNKVCGVTVLDEVIGRVSRGERVIEGWTRPVRSRQPSRLDRLSAREHEILALIAEGLSTRAMASELGVSTNTVRSHVQNVLGKLGVSDRGKAARIAAEAGMTTARPERAVPDLSLVGAPRPDEAIDILLVDDHRVLADVLALRLRMEPAVRRVELASSVPAARAVLNSYRPDLILLDLNLEHSSGLELFADGASYPTVLVLSGDSDPDRVIEALHAGAAGWICKDSEVDLLLRSAARALRGELVVPRAMLQPVLRRLLHATRPDQPGQGFLDELTPRERDVLGCLVAGLTRSEVAARLHLSTNTVRTHVQHLLRRAEVHSTAALVAKTRALGGVRTAPKRPVAALVPLA
jgi:DNA-binding NarL/FixJ family response regulator